jgi:hypothetical protein
MNSFGKRNFMQPANGKAQHALMKGPFFFFMRGGEGFFGSFSPVPKVFPWDSPPPPPIKFLRCLFPKMFPITPWFYSIWFAQSATPMYIT